MAENCLGILHTIKNEEYLIIKFIERGATSFVYLALGKDKQKYAIKLYVNDEAYSTETNLLEQVKYTKNIVKLFYHGEGFIERGYSIDSYKLLDNFDINDSVNFAIFEYLNNGELYNYVILLNKRFSEDISRKIFYEILKAVEACHKSGITHNDIKLENILLSNNYNIKLIDFGFAQKIEN